MKKISVLLVLFTLLQGQLMSQDQFTLTVDYNRTLEEMILTGGYDSVDSVINGTNFPTSFSADNKTLVVEVKLFSFSELISGRGIISEMNKVGYRPANLAELLALGQAYPGLQRHCSIVAFGSFLMCGEENSLVPVLDGGAGRRLGLVSFDSFWGGNNNSYFLGVKE